MHMPIKIISADARTIHVVQFFESFSREDLANLEAIYSPDASFKDPFNEVTGLAQIQAVYAHMFEALVDPRFEIKLAVTEGEHAFITWDFRFRRQGQDRPMCLHGATYLSYAADGRIDVHRDYWDTGEELYAKLPVIGAAVRWLMRRLAAPSGASPRH
jgi:ketosteroid isomerase-like protein